MASERYNPWRHLRSLGHIDLSFPHLPRGVDGRTDGHSFIHIHRGLSQRERRCVAGHEIIHVERKHHCGQNGAVELQVWIAAARRLVDIHHLAGAMAWSRSRHDVAEECWVTEDVLNVRLAHLHPAERAVIHRATAHHREAP